MSQNEIKLVEENGETYEVTTLSTLEKFRTERGFGGFSFKDKYGLQCSLQDSSLATEPAIWLGIDDPEPKIMASDTPQGGTGWVDYLIPPEVLLHTRMHLTQEQVKALLPILQHFAETGEYIKDYNLDQPYKTEKKNKKIFSLSKKGGINPPPSTPKPQDIIPPSQKA